ncbi:MAG TPA: GDP-mannose 4,6-dehydratase [Coriobacteriia bacterium]|nr:GDP-mannose 4,6-dehydratase [Coriobacteriia bacterium]
MTDRPTRALITGAAGQDGTYLTELLLSKGYEVWGVIGPEPGDYLSWAATQGEDLHPCEADLSDKDSLDRLIAEVVPDEVYNFAGISVVSMSWEHPVAVFDINATGVARLIESLREYAPDARLCQASSAEIFGHPAESPQTETTPIRPVTPYGSSKAAAHFLVENAREGRGMFACNAILYNHESPRRPSSFVTAKIAEGAARIKLGLASELRLGNLDSARDWGYAGDYVEAMWLMLQADKPEDFVLATGVAHTVREFCDAAFSHVGLNWEDYVIVDPEFFRPVDSQAPVGDATKAREALGWEASKPFAAIVGEMVDGSPVRLAGE